MNHLAATIVLAVAAALAGCLDGLRPNEASDQNTPAPAAAATNAAPASPIEVEVANLYATVEGTVVELPPESEAQIPYPEVVNGPMGHSPWVWTGVTPIAGNLSETIVAKFWVTSNAGTIAARMIPPFTFENLPGFWVSLSSGEEGGWAGEVAGPDVLITGETVGLEVELAWYGEGPPALPKDAALNFVISAAYTHFTQVAELRLLVGPDHPTGFVLSR